MTEQQFSTDNIHSERIDQLFQKAEQLSADFSLFPEYEDNAVDHSVRGLISPERCEAELERLRGLNIDNYIEQIVAPSESNSRMGAKAVVQYLVLRIIPKWKTARYTAPKPIWTSVVMSAASVLSARTVEHANAYGSLEHHN
ncbi:MAG: hypothetical protein LRY66_16005, partial [Saccharospirillaceae bacterium]|nr:hypothetical protein [Saccharospirillaceae bacterium]